MALRTSLVAQPHLYMGDTTGRPLDAGKVYFGEPNKDPEFYPINVFYDEALTIPAMQPIRTKGGFMNASGQMVEVYATETTYSVKVLDSYGRQVFYQTEMSSTSTSGSVSTKLPYAGAITRSQDTKNNDIPSIKDFANAVDAQAAAISQGVKIFIPTGEHTYDLTDVDMALFWGYGQLKDSVTSAIFKPKNGDFVTPKMFGIREGVDETVKITAMSNYATTNNLPVVWESGKTYKMQGLSQSVLANQSVEWRTSGAADAVIECLTDTNEVFVNINGAVSAKQTVTAKALRGASTIKVASVADFNVGDTIVISSSELYEGDNRGSYSKGETNIIKSIDAATNTLTLQSMLRDTYDVSWSHSGTLTEYTDAWNFKIQPNFPKTSSQRFTTITSPTNGTHSITSMNTVTGAVTLDSQYRAGFTNVSAANPSATSYTISYECTVKSIAAAKVNINNIKIKRSAVLNNAKSFKGLVVTGISDVHVTRNKAINFDYAGIEVRECGLDVDVYKNTILNANNASLGYGVSIIDTSSAGVHGNQSFGCRRCVDVFGVGIIAWDNNVHDNIAHGGGSTSNGSKFYPESGLTGNSGFGSHGGAYNTQYHNNIAVDIETMYTIRGRDENVYNSNAYGACSTLVSIFYGGGTTVDGLYYKDGYSEFGSVDSASNMPSTLNTFRPTRLINIRGGDGLNSRLPITLNNINANSVSDCAIYLDATATKGYFPAINFGNISVTVRQIAGSNYFDFIRRNATSNVTLFLNDMGGNGMFTDQGTYTGYAYMPEAGFTQVSNTFRRVKDSNSYIAKIDKDGVIAIPVTLASMVVFSLIDRFNWVSRDYESDNIRYKNASTYKGVISSNVEFSNSKLTGTTGTNGKITISFVNGWFYIENRYLTTIDPLITLVGV